VSKLTSSKYGISGYGRTRYSTRERQKNGYDSQHTRIRMPESFSASTVPILPSHGESIFWSDMPCWFVLFPLFLSPLRYCYITQPTCCRCSQLISYQIDHFVMTARDRSNICTAVTRGTVEDFYNGVVK
jgi:hypothetical protein